jgi:hypothetical protein
MPTAAVSTRIGRPIEPGDETAFFFAGHGVEISGQSYLLPRDVPKPQSGEASLVKNESLSVMQLLDDLQEKSPRVSLVILDACRDNPFAADGTRSVGGTRGLARVEAPEGTFVMYSAGAGQTALDPLSDSDADANSVFTRGEVGTAETLAFASDGKVLAVNDVLAYDIQLIDPAKAKFLGTICVKDSYGVLESMAVSPDGRPSPQVATTKS